MLKELTAILSDFFEVGSDCYHYILERVKYAELSPKDFREYNDDDVAEIAEYLIANGVTVQRWIPVTERLPHEEDLSALGEVLVMCKSDVCSAVYLPSRSCFYRHGYRQGGVTHWMPMPKAYEEVE